MENYPFLFDLLLVALLGDVWRFGDRFPGFFCKFLGISRLHFFEDSPLNLTFKSIINGFIG